MSDNKKYYYLKLKDNFFDTDELIVLESMPDGHLYSNILLKLYLRSLKYGGRLMFNDRIPYNPTILAQITRHNVGVMEKALSTFKELGLVEMLDTGAIYMSDIQNFIGESSTEADRKRAYRNKIDSEKMGQMSGQMSKTLVDKNPPEIEKDIEKEKEKKLPANKFADDSEPILLSKYLYSKMLGNNPKAKKPNIQSWASHMDKLIRLDNYLYGEIINVIDWCQADNFWKSNILSAKKLRDKMGTLIIQMKNKGVKPSKKSMIDLLAEGAFDD